MLGDKKVSYSAMQSTGTLTLGNYLGALDNWLKMQEEYECFYAIADLHSLTIRQNPAELRKRARDLYALYVAAGLDPETPPTTYDEVLEDAKKIVESGAAPVGYSQAIYGWFFEQQLAGLGVTYGNNDNGRKEAVTAVDFDSNGGGLKVFDMWKKLYDSGYFEDYGTTTADTQTAFFSG